MATVVITPEIEANAKKLAEATGTTPTEAVADALRSQLRVSQVREETAEERESRLRRAAETLRKIHALPVDNSLTEDEILGYDEFGVPEQPYLGR